MVWDFMCSVENELPIELNSLDANKTIYTHIYVFLYIYIYSNIDPLMK